MKVGARDNPQILNPCKGLFVQVLRHRYSHHLFETFVAAKKRENAY